MHNDSWSTWDPLEAIALTIGYLQDSDYTCIDCVQDVVDSVAADAPLEEVIQSVGDWLAARPTADETESLLEAVFQTESSLPVLAERLLAALLLLHYQSRRDCNPEAREMAQIAVVQGATALGTPWLLAATKFLYWVSQQPQPYRSRSQDLLSLTFLITRLLSSAAESSERQLLAERTAFDRRVESDSHPPVLTYSTIIQDEWTREGTVSIEGSAETTAILQRVLRELGLSPTQ
jgi:hypothetical protein